MYLLNEFKRKAQERYLRSKAASGDKVSKEILSAKKYYTKERGIVDQSARNVLAKRTKAADTYTPSIIRGGFTKGNNSILRKNKSQVTLTGKYKGQTGSAIKQSIKNKALEATKQRFSDSVDEILKTSIPKIKFTPPPKVEMPDVDFTEVNKYRKKLTRNSNIRKGLVLGSAVLGTATIASNLLARKTRKDKNVKRGKYNKRK